MSSFVKTFEERKAALFKTFDRLSEEGFIPCTNGEVNYTSDTIEEYKNNLNKQQFYVSVCGQIKAGKSTFLNYLLFKDKAVLPTAPTPWTAKLTRISFGETDHAIVYFYTTSEWAALKHLVVRDENEKEVNYFDKYLRDALNYSASQNVYDREIIQEKRLSHTLTDLNKLATYISSEGAYMPFVSYVEIYVNNPLVRHVIIVDTPGINDPNELRSRITTDFIHLSSAVVYLFAATMPLDIADFKFIDRYLFSIPSSKIIFALAQCDQAEHIDHLTGYIEKHLRNKPELKERNLLANDKVYPFSTMAAIINYKRQHQLPLNEEEAFYAAGMQPELIEANGFFEELVSGIDQRVMSEKAADVLDDAVNKIKTICSLQIKNLLSAIALEELKINDLQLSSAQLNAKVERVNGWMQEINEQITDLQQQKSDVTRSIENKIIGESSDIKESALQEYHNWIEVQSVEKALKISGHEIKSIISREIRKHINQTFIKDSFAPLKKYQEEAKNFLRAITNELMPVSRWGHLFEPIISVHKIIEDSLKSANDNFGRLEKLRENFMLFWTKREATNANLINEAGHIIEGIIDDFSQQLTSNVNKELENFFSELTHQVRKYSAAYSEDLRKLQNNLGDHSVGIEDNKKQLELLMADSNRLQQTYHQIKQTLSVE
ncbi:dynamin family protein [Dyadobacter fanqingshengii]|uniref:Dynamin family protein n=1 Tax=Dyadobacter fanqingshengii TaxID=2906443 RepID=A0A9X1T8P2_9BACT|nr:dynamin family protein [Dyadobacter fanqingshengii]MCF0039738.1 dynamin family protein [Dyadobacter fanqingshengii]USJ38500.1 dynamin family protein [Dyadobacter fanqingshengii]